MGLLTGAIIEIVAEIEPPFVERAIHTLPNGISGKGVLFPLPGILYQFAGPFDPLRIPFHDVTTTICGVGKTLALFVIGGNHALHVGLQNLTAVVVSPRIPVGRNAKGASIKNRMRFFTPVGKRDEFCKDGVALIDPVAGLVGNDDFPREILDAAQIRKQIQFLLLAETIAYIMVANLACVLRRRCCKGVWGCGGVGVWGCGGVGFFTSRLMATPV